MLHEHYLRRAIVGYFAQKHFAGTFKLRRYTTGGTDSVY